MPRLLPEGRDNKKAWRIQEGHFIQETHSSNSSLNSAREEKSLGKHP